MLHENKWNKGHFTHEPESHWPSHLKLSLVEKAELVQVHFTLRSREQQSMWMQDGCWVYMDSYIASNNSCFMVTWTMFNNHLLEVGLTQHKLEDHVNPDPFDLFYFIMCEDLHG